MVSQTLSTQPLIQQYYDLQFVRERIRRYFDTSREVLLKRRYYSGLHVCPVSSLTALTDIAKILSCSSSTFMQIFRTLKVVAAVKDIVHYQCHVGQSHATANALQELLQLRAFKVSCSIAVLGTVFFGYFDPINMFFDNINN